MFSFHITGYEGFDVDSNQYTDIPVDITLFADTVKDALEKAKGVLGHPVSKAYRKIVIEEVPEW